RTWQARSALPGRGFGRARGLDETRPALAAREQVVDLGHPRDGLDPLGDVGEADLPHRVVGPGDPFEQQGQAGGVGLRHPGQRHLDPGVLGERLLALAQDLRDGVERHPALERELSSALVYELEVAHQAPVSLPASPGVISGSSPAGARASRSRRWITASRLVAWISLLNSVRKRRTYEMPSMRTSKTFHSESRRLSA